MKMHNVCCSTLSFGFASPGHPLCRQSLNRQRAIATRCGLEPAGQMKDVTSHARRNCSRRQFIFAVAGLALSRPLLARAADTEDNEAPSVGYVTPSGLRYFDFKVGSGATPEWGNLVELDFAVYTISPNGDALVMAETTFNDKNRSILLHHGNGEAVLGLEEALHTMRVGGRRRVIVPPNLAYSKPGLYPTPLTDRRRRKFFQAMSDTGGTVVFDLELHKISTYPDEHGRYSIPAPSQEEISEILTRAYEEGIAAGL